MSYVSLKNNHYLKRTSNVAYILEIYTGASIGENIPLYIYICNIYLLNIFCSIHCYYAISHYV